MSHSIIPPSSAGIWGKPGGCTGWVTMNQLHPETEQTIHAMEGVASHEIGAALIMASSRGNHVRNLADFENKKASNGIIFSKEMFEAAEIYANDVSNEMVSRSIFGGEFFGNEYKIVALEIHEQSFGTLDQFIYDDKHNKLIIWDYKYGHGVVEAFENWQGINYVKGLFEKFNINGVRDQNLVVEIRIVQPRAFHRDGVIRAWSVKASDLRSHFNILHDNAHKALNLPPVFTSGSHCKHCNGRHACTAALSAGVNLFEVSTKTLPMELSAFSLGVQLKIIRRAKEQILLLETGYEEQVKSKIRTGESVPGWFGEHGVGNEKWVKPIDEIVKLGEIYNVDVKKPVNVKTPNQVRKLGIGDAVIKTYSERSQTGLKIVSDDGIRFREVFGK